MDIRPMGYIFILSSFLLTSCEIADLNKENDDILLAEVYNKKLYLNDIEGMLINEENEQDSISWLNAVVEKWVKETLFLQEAERNLNPDINIDELMRSYRATLILNQYEKNYVETKLDSTILESELTGYYENNKEQYQLQTPIVRCYFLKISRNIPEKLLKQFDDLWKETSKPKSLNELLNLSDKHAKDFILDEDIWTTVSEISLKLPKGSINEEVLHFNKEYKFNDEEFKYYLTILELKSRQEVAPLSYIKDQATRVILNKRKLELINSRKNELYQLESEKNNVKIYLQ